MSTSLAALDALPSITDFYTHYWGKRPFLVRDAIDRTVMDGLITPDALAGLSLEEAARARMVSRADGLTETAKEWTCQFGPFT
ncbi:MAG: cupin domain-containing protein, partial [Proteobacteria bacterium]|nr:cupin domain-containing protein [Pseudomonadota bacterium]